jgi:hypothetical protein
VLFGAVAVLLGCGAVGLGLLHGAAFLLQRAGIGSGPLLDARSVASGLATWVALGFALLALGVGSIRRRRWAPPLLLVLAWAWLACGLLALPFLPGVLDGAFRLVDPEARGAPGLVVVAAVGLALGFGIALPAAFVWVYRDPTVLRTCERFDPRPCWTERCPRSVLGLSASFAVLAVTSLPLALGHPVVPLFGRLITGRPAALLLVLGAALSGWIAHATYHLRRAGWWGATVLLTVAGAATAITLARVEPLGLYRAAGYPEEQLAVLAGAPLPSGRTCAALAWVLTAASLVYMLAVRRHFGRVPRVGSADRDVAHRR